LRFGVDASPSRDSISLLHQTQHSDRGPHSHRAAPRAAPPPSIERAERSLRTMWMHYRAVVQARQWAVAGAQELQM
jgi:hypothetical protein